jgi:hypothetical protein
MVMLTEDNLGPNSSQSCPTRDGPQGPPERRERVAPALPPRDDADSVREIAALRATIALLQTDLAVWKATLGAIRCRSSFRLAEELRMVQEFLMPRGSRRGRIGAACLWVVDGLLWSAIGAIRLGRTCVHGLRALRRPSAATPIPSSTSNDASAKPAPLANPQAAPILLRAPKTAEAPRTSGRLRSDRAHPGDSPGDPYLPLHWHLHEKDAADSRFLGLFILSAGQRAGSTLLQRICNARKGTLIWGEHGGFLSHFTDIYANASYFALSGAGERNLFFGRGEDPNLWTASMSPDLDYVQLAMVDGVRALLNSLYGQYREQHDLLGFKEVRYGTDEAELLLKCYPASKFLLLVRNPFNCWKSMLPEWGWTVDRWASEWDGFVRSFRSLAAAHERCHLIRYEDIIQQETHALETIEDVARVSRRQVLQVLANKLGSSGARQCITDADRDVILRHCRKSMQALGY